jgi:hypothetical protein
VLRDRIAPQAITATTQISISTNPAAPHFGGGADNIAFLEGDPASNMPNAQAFQMDATFWIETVEETITVPIFMPGHPPLTIKRGSAVCWAIGAVVPGTTDHGDHGATSP